MGTAVALEAMKMMAETDYETMVMEKGKYLLQGLEELKRRHKIVGDVDDGAESGDALHTAPW